VAAGLVFLATVEPGDSYVSGILPGVVVLGLGLSITVAPLTATVLAAVPDERSGVGSAINNAVARIGSLLAVALLPGLAGLDDSLAGGYVRAMLLAAAIAASGSLVAVLTVRRVRPVRPVPQVAAAPPCLSACLEQAA
jgi:hypothetical protein